LIYDIGGVLVNKYEEMRFVMEIEKKLDREQTVVLLRQLADALEKNDNCTVSIGDEAIELPIDLDIELEYEQDADKAELEIEMKWLRIHHEDEEKRTGKFEIFKGADKQWYFHLKAANGEIILASEGYKRKQGAENGISAVKSNVDLENIEFRKSQANQPYFVLIAANGEIVGVSQMYKRQVGARKGAASVIKNAPAARIVDI
jgi:amphi-Trp domain-containing protein